ncbi:MAG: indole-3-glycerol phosphate synthase TrpC [Candidatus Omnitrophica bacterium]|nr:indole-3-glycerol phosphate synthase TrpC [Candidatus Omnitrophota bacterium]
MILTEIIETKRKEVERSRKKAPQEDLIARLEGIAPRPKNLFKNSLSKPHKIHLIAEVKKASPSAGVIREDFNPVKIASVYQANGASAISVLTDKKFFQGKLSYLKEIRKGISLPILRKDFIIDEYQIYESVLAGADAALLIADLLSVEEIKRFLEIGSRYSIDFLVEVHGEEDVKKALDSGCDIIGINNRDLHTFKVDIKTTPRLLKMIPGGKVIVSESGIKSKENISYLRSFGINAVLVGEALMRSEDIGEKMRELIG